MALIKIIMSALAITKKYCCPVTELETRIQINDYTVCISAILRIEGNIKLPTIQSEISSFTYSSNSILFYLLFPEQLSIK